MKYNIMIAEDDEDIIELLSLYLDNEGFSVYSASNGEDALEILKNNPVDLMIVDIMMPGMNGYETIKNVRAFSSIPIIILSAKSMDQDKILGLGIGADAYITKPFNPLEVIANIKALLRRIYDFDTNVTESNNSASIKIGELEYDGDKLLLRKNNEIVTLTATELKILVKLMKSPGRIYTKAQLYEAINNYNNESDEDTMMVHISKIRSKIEDDPSNPKYIKTVRGLGYKIDYEDN